MSGDNEVMVGEKRSLDDVEIAEKTETTDTTDVIDDEMSRKSKLDSVASKIQDAKTAIKDSDRPASTSENGLLKPAPTQIPISIGRHPVSKKYILPQITRDDTLNARIYLKYYGLKTFLNTYLPEKLNAMYLFLLIKLLGFEITDSFLLNSVSDLLETDPAVLEEYKLGIDSQKDSRLLYSYNEDPLEKKAAVCLIKDLQKAINKILSTRIKLSSFYTVDHFVQKLKNAKRILVLTGAGVSTSLGIPDFRSSEGFYSKIKHLGLDDPQDVFNYDIFSQDPSVFYNIAHMVLPPENVYSPLHSFIKMLQDKKKLLRNYTQNIDNLESYAGIEAEKLVQCHGSFATASCITCHWQLPGEKIFQNIRNLELPLCPYCYAKRKQYFPTEPVVTDQMEEPENNLISSSVVNNVPKSYGVLKPDITFFGEALPSKFHKTIREDILNCDLLICIGTSLKVAPVSEIVNMLPAHVPQVLINKDPVKHAEFDLSLLGLCDDVVAHVTRKCDWDIPHKSWPQLKETTFNCVEKDYGIYTIST